MAWFLYLLECEDGSVYTGIAVDVAARFAQHADGSGARYTRSRKPVRVLASFELGGRAQASRAEYWVKRLRPHEKRALAAGQRSLESVLPAARDAAADSADSEDLAAHATGEAPAADTMPDGATPDGAAP